MTIINLCFLAVALKETITAFHNFQISNTGSLSFIM